VIGQLLRINLLYSPTGEYNKIEIFKMAASRFVEVSDKEISEIKMISDQKNTKKLVQKYQNNYSPQAR
jgi:tRNA U34 2-thiouridine synthase MnmA/TrmU